MLGLQNPSQTLDVFGKTWEYQIPKLSARSSANDKDTSTTNTSTVAASPLSVQETNTNKSMMNSTPVHPFGGNQMLSNKTHGGRASSVSPKYNLNTESISNFNKDIHIYKSSSSDALQHQPHSSGHHMQLSR